MARGNDEPRPARKSNVPMVLRPKFDYMSFLAYFANPLPDVRVVVEAVRGILLELLGDREVFRGQYTREVRSEQRAQEACSGQHAPEVCSGQRVADDAPRENPRARLADVWDVDLHARGVWTYALPEGPNRYEEYGFQEDLFTVEYDAESILLGRPTGCRLRIGLNVDRLSEEQRKKLLGVVKRLSEIVTSSGVFCSGFCDVSDVSQTLTGRRLATPNDAGCDFQRRLVSAQQNHS